MGNRDVGGNEDQPRVVVRRRMPSDTDASEAFGEEAPTSPGRPWNLEVMRSRGCARPRASHPIPHATEADELLAWAVALMATLEADELIELMPSASRENLTRDLIGLLAELDAFEAPATALGLWLSSNPAVARVHRDDYQIAAALCASASLAR